ncbi:MAG: TlpA family protein disulfide reductase [Bdellovibrionales bacterium]|nr:TlpA family protein disulfide reductase [Bdellovibrionales bacterium]
MSASRFGTLAALTTVFALSFSFTSTANAKLKEGAEFPALVSAPFPGAPKVDAAKLMKGKVVIVDFWASWCEPCKIELPALNAHHKKFKGKVMIVGINVDDDINEAKSFLKEHGVSFPLAYDKDKKMVNALEISTMPTSFILSEGKVIKIHSGFRAGDEKKIEEEIKSLLKK